MACIARSARAVSRVLRLLAWLWNLLSRMDVSKTPSAPWDTGVGRKAVGGWFVLLLAILLGGIGIVLAYALVAFWPPELDPNATGVPATSVSFFGLSWSIPRETSMFALVAIGGALGGMVHVLRSFFRYAGERNLIWSWVPSYFLIPVVGALLASITYILLRAGLLTNTGTAQGSPYGFAAVATLVGLFSSQAATKLKQVFETLFAQSSRGSESVMDPAGEPPPAG